MDYGAVTGGGWWCGGWCGVLVAIGGGGYWGQKIYKKFQDLANSAGIPTPYRLQMGVG